jgi:hypothetical protein
MDKELDCPDIGGAAVVGARLIPWESGEIGVAIELADGRELAMPVRVPIEMMQTLRDVKPASTPH